LCGNCLIKQVTEGKIDGRIEVGGGRGRRRKQLQDDLKEKGDTEHLKKKRHIARCGEVDLGEAMDLT
jgi:hypothetical protein